MIYNISGDFGGFNGAYYYAKIYQYCTKKDAIRKFKEHHGIVGKCGVTVYVNGQVQ